jgi:hypothetical protein
MSAARPRHSLVIATKCEPMGTLPSLDKIAKSLDRALTDEDVGACIPGLPDGRSLLADDLEVEDIRAAIRAATAYAAAKGAVLVLVLMGHGIVPSGGEPHLYLMAANSTKDRDMAVDVPALLTEAVDRAGVSGLIAIVDTCFAAGAQPSAASLSGGMRSGKVRLDLLMASTVTQPAYGMKVSRELTRILEAGIASADAHLRLDTLMPAVRAAVLQHDIVVTTYDGSPEPAGLWLAHNQRISSRLRSVLGPRGTGALVRALSAFDPGHESRQIWNLLALRDLETEVLTAPDSPGRTRVLRLLKNLDVARRTAEFLTRFMPAELTTARLHRAMIGLPTGPPQDLTGALDAVEYLAVNPSPGKDAYLTQLARFVTALADDAGSDLDDRLLLEWATEIGALTPFNDARSRQRDRTTERRLRLIVNLQSVSESWPLRLAAWLLVDSTVDRQESFSCVENSTIADQASVEAALTDAVFWAKTRADELELPLARIEVAAPARLLLRWRPENVLYGTWLGDRHEVLVRWSERLAPTRDKRWINEYALTRLAEIDAQADGGRLHWMTTRELGEQAALTERLQAGRYQQAIGLEDDPGDGAGVLELLLPFSPILVWPHKVAAGPDHKDQVEARWRELPLGFLKAYRSWKKDGVEDPVAQLRAIWEDEDWLRFCRSLQLRSGSTTRGT